MTIEVITGTPGAGKTTFAVAERIAHEVGRSFALDDDTCIKLGLELKTVVKRRVVQAGIRGLVIEHERIGHVLTRDQVGPKAVADWNQMVVEHDDKGKPLVSETPVHQRIPGEPPLDVEPCAQNWWLWCKPGDLIVIDEAQYLMPRGTLGAKPPYWLHVMGIHRHYGVDFILITQHINSIDTFVRGLCSLHRHVRSVMAFPVCAVYAWDHSSNTDRITLASKKLWWRRRKHYRLFHSTVAVIKPPAAGRAAATFAIALLLAVAVGFKLFVGKFGAPASPSLAAGASPASAPRGVQPIPVSYPSSRTPGYDLPKLSGCYSQGETCRCIDTRGAPVRVAYPACKRSSEGFDSLLAWEPRSAASAPPGAPYGAAAPLSPSLPASASPTASVSLPGVQPGIPSLR